MRTTSGAIVLKPTKKGAPVSPGASYVSTINWIYRNFLSFSVSSGTMAKASPTMP